MEKKGKGFEGGGGALGVKIKEIKKKESRGMSLNRVGVGPE